MDGRDIFRTDMGFYIEIMSRPLKKSSYRIHVFWSTNNIDRSSHEKLHAVLVLGQALQEP